MSHQDELIRNLSTLSPEAQQASYSALQTGYYGAVNIYARERGGDWLKAKQYLDQFFSTPEGRRFESRQVDVQERATALGFSSVTEYQQYQGFAGRPTKSDIPTEQAGVYETPSGMMSIDPSKAGGVPEGARYVSPSTPSIFAIDKRIPRVTDITPVREIRKPVSVVSAYAPPKWKESPLQRSQYELKRIGERETQRPSPTYIHVPKEILLAGGAFAVGTAQFAKGLVTGETYKGFGAAITKPKETIGIPIGKVIKKRPVYAVTTGALIIAAPKIIAKAPVKVSDIIRTARLKELPVKRIVAPEYYKGQRFPTIKKGQTAKQLMKEFKPILPKEKLPAGFTAAPKPFKKVTEAKAGTSELAGLYQAPKVSPHFLKIGGEEVKMFGLSPFETWRPSIVRITPSEYKIVPSVGKVPTMRAGVKEFFKKEAELGKAYIPFIKREKEAIIPMGTPLQQIRKKHFIKFEGRRIPISEFEVVKGIKFEVSKGVKMPKIPKRAYTMEDVSRSLSRGRVGKKARITPSKLISVTRRPSYKPSVKVPSSKVSYKPSRYLGYPPTKYPVDPSYKIMYKPSRYLGYPPTKYPPYFYYFYYYPSARVPSPIKPPRIRDEGRKVKPLLFPQLKPQPKKYQASLRSKALGIRAVKISKAYKMGAGGIATRPIIVTKKRK